MKQALIYGSIIVTAILFGGCQQVKPTAVAPKPVVPVTTPVTGSAAKATPVAKAEDPEVKAVTDELNNLDSANDFAPYTASDIK